MRLVNASRMDQQQTMQTSNKTEFNDTQKVIYRDDGTEIGQWDPATNTGRCDAYTLGIMVPRFIGGCD